MASEIYNLDDVPSDESAITAGSSTDTVDELRQENEDGSITLTLKYPVRIQYKRDGRERDETIEQLNIRRANGGDVRMTLRLQNDEEKLIVELFKRLTRLPETAFDHLDADDFVRFSKEVERFFPESRPTGKKF